VILSALRFARFEGAQRFFFLLRVLPNLNFTSQKRPPPLLFHIGQCHSSAVSLLGSLDGQRIPSTASQVIEKMYFPIRQKMLAIVTVL
jgi:hypothetical protein